MVLFSWALPRVHYGTFGDAGIRSHAVSVTAAVSASFGNRRLASAVSVVVLTAEALLLVGAGLMLTEVWATRVSVLGLVAIVFGGFAVHTGYVVASRDGDACGCSSDPDETANVWSAARPGLVSVAAVSSMLLERSSGGLSGAGAGATVLAISGALVSALLLWSLPDCLTQTRPCDLSRSPDFVELLRHADDLAGIGKSRVSA